MNLTLICVAIVKNIINWNALFFFKIKVLTYAYDHSSMRYSLFQLITSTCNVKNTLLKSILRVFKSSMVFCWNFVKNIVMNKCMS